MFLRKLAASVGRLDFWNLKREMTPFQLAVHRAAWDIEPLGDDRADMRQTRHTLALIQSQRTKPMTSDEYELETKWLMEYLPVHQCQPAVEMTPDEAAKAGRQQFAGISQ